jgi:hypothetical protein
MGALAKGDRPALARAGLFGLAALMLKTLEESANAGVAGHGEPALKVLGRARRAEYDNQRPK